MILEGGSLAPEGGNGLRDFLLEDFDEDFVFFDDFLLGLDLSDDLPSSEFRTNLRDSTA
jgi:hypothetical protein